MKKNLYEPVLLVHVFTEYITVESLGDNVAIDSIFVIGVSEDEIEEVPYIICGTGEEQKIVPTKQYDSYKLECAKFIHINPKELLNTKICITSTEDECDLTVGKIYEIVDGYFIADDGVKYPFKTPLVDTLDLEKYFSEDGRDKKNDIDSNTFAGEKIGFIEIVE